MSGHLTSIDLFAGAGGLSLGLEAAGIRTVAAVEIDPDAVQTYRAALPHVRVLQDDVRIVDFTQFRGIDVVSGGPPCQPFSIGGRRRGREDDRDFLPEFVRAILEVRPRAFIMENVPGLGSNTHSSYLREVLSPLIDLYRISGPHLVNAADYGVPQSRRRIVIVGMADREFALPTGSPKAWVPSGAVLSDIAIGDPNPSRIIYARKPDLRPNPYHGHLFNGGGRGINLEMPSPTILASAGGNKTHFIDVGRYVPPYHFHLLNGGRPRNGYLPEARRITVVESAALQTFPKGMKFAGSRSSQYNQIGNAVPMLLAKVIGTAVAEQVSVHRRKASALQ